MDKKIIVDCDGVLLDWAYAFDVWMREQGYYRLPNTSHYYDQSLRFGIDSKMPMLEVKLLVPFLIGEGSLLYPLANGSNTASSKAMLNLKIVLLVFSKHSLVAFE